MTTKMDVDRTPLNGESRELSPVFSTHDLTVYNMLITTLFLLFVLTTVALLIFLLMRRPPCCPCCQDPYDTSASAGSTGSQAANITYLTETHGIVVKKWMKDSPPPYESPPDYSSLSPELIMDAKTLQDLVTTTNTPPPPPPPSQASAAAAQTTLRQYSSSSNTHHLHHHASSAGAGGSSAGQGQQQQSSSHPGVGVTVDRSASPLCTTPLFSAAFCDSPRSLTPTIHHDAKPVACLYDRSSSPIFTQYASPPALRHKSSASSSPSASSSSASSSSTTTYIASVAAPSAVYGQVTPSPPSYESLQQVYCHEGGGGMVGVIGGLGIGRRKEDTR